MKSVALCFTTLVAGVVIGMMAGGAGFGKKSGETREVQGKSLTRRGGGHRMDSVSDQVLAELLKGRSPSELRAEEAYELLLPWFSRSIYDRFWDTTAEGVRLNYQFQLLMEKLPTPVLEQVLDLARGGNVPFYLSRDACAAYALRDWDKAMTWASRQRDFQELKSAAISRIVDTNPDRALALYQSAMDDPFFSDEDYIVRKLASQQAKRGHAALIDFLAAQASCRPGETSSEFGMISIIGDLPPDEIPPFLEEYQERNMASKTGESIDFLMRQVADTHPETFRKWFESLTPTEQARTHFELALTKSAAGRADETRELLVKAMAGTPGGRGRFLRENLYLLHYYPLALKEAESLLRDDERLSVNEDLFSSVTPGEEPGGFFDRARLLPKPQEQAEYLVRSLGNLVDASKLSPRNFDIFASRLESFGLTGEDARRTKAALEEARRSSLEKPDPDY